MTAETAENKLNVFCALLEFFVQSHRPGAPWRDMVNRSHADMPH